MNEIYKKCRGCTMIKKCRIKPKYEYKDIQNGNYDSTCPCTLCLVKTICDQSCDLYENYINENYLRIKTDENP